MKKTIEETYKQMSEVEHILARPGMYVGSTKEEQKSQFVYDYNDAVMKMKDVTIIPAIIKLIDEMLPYLQKYCRRHVFRNRSKAHNNSLPVSVLVKCAKKKITSSTAPDLSFPSKKHSAAFIPSSAM